MFLLLCGQPDAVSNGHLDELLYSHVDVPTNGLRKVLLHSLHQQGKSLDHGNDLTEGRGGGRGGEGRGRQVRCILNVPPEGDTAHPQLQSSRIANSLPKYTWHSAEGLTSTKAYFSSLE